MKIRKAVVVGAVAVGSLLLVGPTTAAVLIGAVQMVAHLAGGEIVGGQYVALVLASSAVGIKAAGEVAMVRLNGYEALHREPGGRTALRYSVLLVPLFAALALVGRFLVMMAGWGFEGQPVVLGFVCVLVLSIGWVATRTIRSYRRARRPDV